MILKPTLLITTYNWTEALLLSLNSIVQQSILPFEILIADDGSTEHTKNTINSFSKKTSIPVIHVWQEDKGFRKSSVLNKAILKSKGDYIIQIDGDIILHKHFIKDHLNNATNNTFLFGSRVSLNATLSKKILANTNVSINYFSSGIKKRNRLIRIPFFNIFKASQNKNSKKLRGCNISYWKKDALAINGYNEDFQGWGYEDYEFAQRLINNNVLAKRIKHIAIQYHLHHNEAPKGNTSKGDSLLINTIKNKICYVENGIYNTLK